MTGAPEGRAGVIAGAREMWAGGRPSARRAGVVCALALALTGLPVVGLVVAVAGIVLAVRARREDVAVAGDPSRLATLALLGGMLAAALATAFTAALALLWIAAR